MGGGSVNTRDWDTYKTSRKLDDVRTTAAHVFTKSSIDDLMDPKSFDFRESRDSETNPESTPIILGADVTGSMSPVLLELMKKALPTICQEIYTRLPVTDPHIATVAIGDIDCDRHPFQVTQFEADIKIFESLEKLFLEGGGGGNNHESYTLAWYFAHFMTKTDSFIKRGVKGFIFTWGDEEINPVLSDSKIASITGKNNQGPFDSENILKLVSEKWEVYHIIIKQGDHARSRYSEVVETWNKVLGAQRVISLDDYTKLGETIVSILELHKGKSLKDVASSWNGSTYVTISNALKNVTPVSDSKSKVLANII